VAETVSQTEPKKRSTRFYAIFAVAILTLAIAIGVAIEGLTSYGQGPVYIDKVVTDKPYYLQGEKANFK
jgi:hypothetical protein